MRILSCCPWSYCGGTTGPCYEYLSFVEVPRRMGHAVHHFDHGRMARVDRDHMNEFFLSVVRNGGYDLVFVMMRRDEFIRSALVEARRHAPVVAWNCDDDWRWEGYSSQWADCFTYMVTTYRSVYEANRTAHPNLVLSQWGCTGLFDGAGVAKDIGISFVGQCYGERWAQVARLQRDAGLVAYGRGVPPVSGWRGRLLQRLAWRVPGLSWDAASTALPRAAAVSDIWNRSRLSFTPLRSSRADTYQVKARVFDMGLSGTVMLCDRSAGVDAFYEPEKEFIPFDSIEECIARARQMLANESARREIAERYRTRTMAEHLWQHRLSKLYTDIGVL